MPNNPGNMPTTNRRNFLLFSGATGAAAALGMALSAKPIMDPKFVDVLDTLKHLDLSIGKFQDFGSREIVLIFPGLGREISELRATQISSLIRFYEVNNVCCQGAFLNSGSKSPFISQALSYSYQPISDMSSSAGFSIVGLEDQGINERVENHSDLFKALKQYDDFYNLIHRAYIDPKLVEAALNNIDLLEDKINTLIDKCNFIVTLEPFDRQFFSECGNYENILIAVKQEYEGHLDDRYNLATALVKRTAAGSKATLTPVVFASVLTDLLVSDLTQARISFIELPLTSSESK